MLGAFGVAGLLLAAIGLYGVIAYTVAQRARELGLRMALGASARQVMRLVMRNAIVLILVGVVIGGVAALALTRLLTSFLFGISPADPTTFAGVLFTLTAVAMVASYPPASQAMRVDPMVALRHE